MSRNAREEFISEVKREKVICAYIYQAKWSNTILAEYVLKKWYTEADYDAFLKSLSFTYDAGYWWQVVFWYIWLEDWKRCERWEYDWSEWWELKKCPEINAKCISDN